MRRVGATWTPASEFEPPFCPLSRSLSRDSSGDQARRKADPQHMNVEQVEIDAGRRRFEIEGLGRTAAAGGVHQQAGIPVAETLASIQFKGWMTPSHWRRPGRPCAAGRERRRWSRHQRNLPVGGVAAAKRKAPLRGAQFLSPA